MLHLYGMPFLYFAYGSNLLPERLLPRCPSARTIGRAKADGFDLDFSKVSKDKSGKATLVEAAGAVTPGALYEIDDDELRSLDKHEGLGSGYYRTTELRVELDGTSELIDTVSYIADDRNANLKPYDWYLALVIAGAQHHGLAAKHLERLQSVQYTIDSDIGRVGRRGALAAFEAHGVGNYQEFLSRGQ